MKQPKPRKCKGCGEMFTPPVHSSLATSCSYGCAFKVTDEKIRKKAAKAIQKERKERLKTLTEHLNDAQKEFNKFIRLRDRDLPCISCGRFHNGQYHAGHYRTTAAASQLRFDERNVHKQCSPCNNHKSGNVTEYRINLIKKIGQENVEALENNSETRRYTIEEAKAIKKKYRDKCKELEG